MNIFCKKLDKDYTKRELSEIAGLIYDTDPYIYPAMFQTREHALEIIPKMIVANDTMFCEDNLYVAKNSEKIVGIVLWHRGPLSWSADTYFACGGDSPHIDEVRLKYFASYSETKASVVSLINVCTSIHGHGIGSELLRSFLREVEGPYELFVLSDNASAIKLYEKVGFSITQQMQGFSLTEPNPSCFQMVSDA